MAMEKMIAMSPVEGDFRSFVQKAVSDYGGRHVQALVQRRGVGRMVIYGPPEQGWNGDLESGLVVNQNERFRWNFAPALGKAAILITYPFDLKEPFSVLVSIDKQDEETWYYTLKLPSTDPQDYRDFAMNGDCRHSVIMLMNDEFGKSTENTFEHVESLLISACDDDAWIHVQFAD
jgi:hypothetical protein